MLAPQGEAAPAWPELVGADGLCVARGSSILGDRMLMPLPSRKDGVEMAKRGEIEMSS